MRRTGLAAALLAIMTAPAVAQPRPATHYAPILEQVCLPLLKGGTVDHAAANARPLAFAQNARNATMVTLARDESFSLTLGPAFCYLTLSPASPSQFVAVERELRAWLPRLGRYWASGIEPDAILGVRARKYRAGGFTVTLEEQVDEYGRRLNLTMGP
jgi:hypothetical protein